MATLEELIERREIDIRCWRCDWTDARTLSWLSAQRHMNCPGCAAVIVLDTSTVRREVSRQRKQVSALHGQMVDLLQAADKISRRAQVPARMSGRQPKSELELERSHPNTLMSSLRPAAAARKFPR